MYIYCCTKVKKVGLLTVFNIGIDRIFTICGRILIFFLIFLGIQGDISPSIDSQVSFDPGFSPYNWQWLKTLIGRCFASQPSKSYLTVTHWLVQLTSCATTMMESIL